MGRLRGVAAAVYRNMWGFAGGAFISYFVLGLLTKFWPFITDLDSFVIRLGAGSALGAIVSFLSSRWGGTGASAAAGAGFVVGALAGGAAGLVLVGVASGAIAGGLVGAEVHRPYESTFKK